MVEIIGDITTDTRWASNRILVKKGDEYFVVSHIEEAFDHGNSETLVFRSDSDGVITDWMDVAGGPLVTVDEAIQELEDKDV